MEKMPTLFDSSNAKSAKLINRKIVQDIVNQAFDEADKQRSANDFWFTAITSIMAGIYTVESFLQAQSKAYESSFDRLTNKPQSLQ